MLFKIFGGTLIFSITSILIIFTSRKPSHSRNWSLDQKVLPSAIINENQIEIKNIRFFTYKSENNYSPGYYNKNFDLEKLQTVDYIVEPLASVAAAHTFLSFGFEGGDYLAISIESRRETNELFSPLKGLIRQYELMYVIADERDVLQLRTIHRKRDVYLYPIKATPEKIRELFLDMLTRTNNIKKNPEFYNTITNSCSTNIAKHVNKISPNTIPWDYRLILPKNSDAFAYELGLIDNSLSLKELRKKYLITPAVNQHFNSPDFSTKIRQELGVL